MIDAVFCDLHMHSTASDGTDAPDLLPRLALDAGLQALALTDHDTTAGLADARRAAEALDLAFVSGIELSADPTSLFNREAEREAVAEDRSTLHLLGYFVDEHDAGLLKVEARLQRDREQRNPAIVENLNTLGVRITYDEVMDFAHRQGAVSVGRPHIAQLLMQKGYVKSMHEAFTRYVGATGAAFAPRRRLSAEKAIKAIRDAGGLAVIAHPVQLNMDDVMLAHALARLVDLGLQGIETRHPDHEPADVRRYTELATRHGLVATGGSDYHGANKPNRLGETHVPLAAYHALLEAHSTHISA